MVENAENPSPAPDVITSPELEEGIINGRITTFTITREALTYYQQAARKTNFEVTEIAKPGQYYITGKSNVRRRNTNALENKTPTITAVKSQFPVKEDSVGISLKRPEGVLDDTAFNLARQRIQPI